MSVHRVDLGFQPRRHQHEAWALCLAYRFVVLVWHRRAGKTVFALMRLIFAALRCKRPMGRFGYIAPQRNQAKDIVWAYLLAFTAKIPGCKVSLEELSVTFVNGARIRLYGADNPDTIRGAYFDGVVLDEVAQMKPQVWGEIVRPMLADRNGWAIFLGTPKGVNLFSQLYYAAISGKDPEWAGDMRRADQTGVFSEAELDSIRRDPNVTPAQYAQEFSCDFAAAVTNALLSLGDVLAAKDRAVGKEAYDYAPKVLGLDFAREGDDRSCIYPRQGLVAFKPRIMRIPDSMVLAGQIADYCEKWQPDAIFADNGGMGGPIIDRLRQLGLVVIGVNFGGKATDPRYVNKRTEMWATMAAWVRDVGCIPDLPELTQDLTAPTYSFSGDSNQMVLEPKKKMKERGLPSPDVGDALALTFAAPVAIRDAYERAAARLRTVRGPGVSPNDFDPFLSGA